MSGAAIIPPDWDRLFEIAAAQDGLFTTQQAAEAGYSPQLLAYHLSAGRMVRLRRGVYRLVHFPAGDHEDLTLASPPDASRSVENAPVACARWGGPSLRRRCRQ